MKINYPPGTIGYGVGRIEQLYDRIEKLIANSNPAKKIELFRLEQRLDRLLEKIDNYLKPFDN